MLNRLGSLCSHTRRGRRQGREIQEPEVLRVSQGLSSKGERDGKPFSVCGEASWYPSGRWEGEARRELGQGKAFGMEAWQMMVDRERRASGWGASW